MTHQFLLLPAGNKQTLWQCMKTALAAFILVFVISSCSKQSRHEDAPQPTASLILKIAPSQQKFDEWTNTVITKKLGAAHPYTVEKITYSEKDEFKLAQVTVKTHGIHFDFYIGTLFNFTQKPEPGRYVLKPITDVPTPVRTLIFSEGAVTGDISLSCSTENIYTVTTTGSNLFFIGAM